MGRRAGLLSVMVRVAKEHERAQRRQLREAQRREREVASLYKAQAKQYEQELARAEAARFEAYLGALESIHRECTEPLDWVALRDAPPPARPPEPPPPDRSDVEAAEQALSAHSPGMFERMGVSKKTKKLQAALESRRQEWAIESERRAAAHREQLAAWDEDHGAWKERAELAAAILRGDEGAYQWVLTELAPLSELVEVAGAAEGKITLSATQGEVEVVVAEDTVVPAEEVRVTKTGKRSTKAMAKGRRHELYQDFVAGAALRCARELFAAFPLLERCFVHIATPMLNTATGHMEPLTVLSVMVPRGVQTSVNWDAVDASDLVESLEHNMKFRKTKGLAPVERLPDSG